jgi:hypothetical protein
MITTASGGSLPPPAISDEQGKPLLSWRVALLPHLGQDELYDQFHLNEPWDSPHNLTLLERMPKVYRRPKAWNTPDSWDSGITETYYQLFVGPGAVFEENWSAALEDIADPLDRTILVGENSVAVPWTKPEDMPFNPHTPLPLTGSGIPHLIQFACCDGSVRGVLSRNRQGHAPANDPLRPLITCNAGGDGTDLLD